MIISSPTKIDWESDDAKRLQEFLDSSTGRRLMEVLSFHAPALLDGSHPNKTLVASGVCQGYHQSIDLILRLTQEDPKPAPPSEISEYVSLDDDGAWKDVDKENGYENVDKSEK